MRYLFSLIICLILTATIVCGQSGATLDVLDAEAQRFEAMIRKDTARLKDFLKDDLVYIHSNALTETKTDHLNAIGSGKIVYKTMERTAGTQVRRQGKWAITNGIIHVTGILNNNPFDVQMRYTAVYRKQQGKWRLASWQSTRIP